MPAITVRKIPWLETIPLRSEVLRPGLPLNESMFAGDELTSSNHWGAFDEEGRLRAVGSVHWDLYPMSSPGASAVGPIPPSWRIRGMASHPDVRGQGFGEAVLKAILEWVGADDSGDLWCNARETAIRFYERHGFRIIGERFEIPNAGPHFRMWLPRGRDRDAAH